MGFGWRERCPLPGPPPQGAGEGGRERCLLPGPLGVAGGVDEGIGGVAVKVWGVGADGSGMKMLSDVELIAVGMGLALFLLAFSRIMTAEARRSLELHFVHVKAMEIRNNYTRTLMAMRPGASDTDEEPIEVSPVDEVSGDELERAA